MNEGTIKRVWKLDIIVISWLEIDRNSGQPRYVKREYKDEVEAQKRIDRLITENPSAINIQKKLCYKLVEE